MTAGPRQGWTLTSVPFGAWVFLGVFLLRLVLLVRLTESPFLLPAQGDMHFYNEWALRILRGNWTEHTAFYGLPLYAYLLAGIYQVCGYNPFVPGFLQVLCEGGTAVLLYKLGARVFAAGRSQDSVREALPPSAALRRPEVIGLLAATGWAFFLPAQAYSIILMPTAWLVFVFWFVVWQIVKAGQKGIRPLTCLALGLLIGFTAMGIATILFIVPLVLVAIVVAATPPSQEPNAAAAMLPKMTARWRPLFRRRGAAATWAVKLAGVVLLFAGVGVGTSPAWIHNYFVARDRVFLSAHSGVNFWIGNNPVANGYPKFPPGLRAGQAAMLQDSITTAEKAAGRPLKRSEVSAYWSEKARAWIRANPGAWVQLLGTKIKNFWSAFRYDDISVLTALRDQAVLPPGLEFGIVAALGLPGLLLACWRFSAARWIAAAVLLHMASLLTVFVTERYRLAAVPGLLLFASFGLWHLWHSLATKRYLASAIFLLLFFCCAAFVSQPQRDSTLWALDTYNSGLQALAARQFPLARQRLDLAYAYSPENSEINFAKGNLHLALGDSQSAKSFYGSTLRLNPEHAGAYNNLGVLALQEERWEMAEQFFARALQQSPEDAKSHYLLARARFGARDVSGARRALDRAIQIDPRQPEFRALADELR